MPNEPGSEKNGSNHRDSGLDNKFRNYVDAKLSKRSTEVIMHRPGVVVYRSVEFFENDDANVNRNGAYKDANGEAIVCRHLSFEWLRRHKRNLPRVNDVKQGLDVNSYASVFASDKGIALAKSLVDNIFDRDHVERRADQYIAVNIDGNGFGQALHGICESLQSGQTRLMTLRSENHLMAVVTQRKLNPDRFIIKFYDPNKTLHHVRAVVESLDAVKALSFADFVGDDLDKTIARMYFPSNKSAILSIYNDMDQLRSCHNFEPDYSIGFDMKRLSWKEKKIKHSELLFHCLLLNLAHAKDHCNALLADTDAADSKADLDLLQPKSIHGCSALYSAISKGCTEAALAMMRAILRSSLGEADKLMMLDSRFMGMTVFGLAYSSATATAVADYVDVILCSELSVDGKMHVLKAVHGHSISGLCSPVVAQRWDVFAAAARVIFCSNLPVANKVELLMAKSGCYSLLYLHLRKGSGELAEAFAQAYVDAMPENYRLKLMPGGGEVSSLVDGFSTGLLTMSARKVEADFIAGIKELVESIGVIRQDLVRSRDSSWSNPATLFSANRGQGDRGVDAVIELELKLGARPGLNKAV